MASAVCTAHTVRLAAVSASSHPYGAIDLTSCEVAVIRKHFLRFHFLVVRLVCFGHAINRKCGRKRRGNLISMASFSVRSLCAEPRGTHKSQNKLFSMRPIVVIAYCNFAVGIFAFALTRSARQHQQETNKRLNFSLNLNDSTNWREWTWFVVGRVQRSVDSIAEHLIVNTIGHNK